MTDRAEEIAGEWADSVTQRVIDACRTGLVAGRREELSGLRDQLENERRAFMSALFVAYVEVPLDREGPCDSSGIAEEAEFALRRIIEDAVAIASERGWRPHRREVPSKIRSLVYRRDGYACVECGDDDVTRLTLDHRHPLSLGGSDEPGNLRTLCRGCNSRKGARL